MNGLQPKIHHVMEAVCDPANNSRMQFPANFASSSAGTFE
jgi:hypothetical protein